MIINALAKESKTNNQNIYAVDPARFVVRRDAYTQMHGFPEACAQTTAELLVMPDIRFPELYRLLSGKITSSRILNRDWAATRRPGFGVTRGGEEMNTDLVTKYAIDGEEAIELHGTRNTIITHAESGYPKIVLTRMDLTDNTKPVLWHPPVPFNDEQTDYMEEHRWSAICQTFEQATDVTKSTEERKRNSLKCYALLSHDCPYIRGSATLARIVLEYLFQKAELQVPFTKAGVDLNTKAITRSVDQFINEWEAGEYFDNQVTSENIMRWRDQKIAESISQTAR